MMAKNTKAAKLRAYFRMNPDATTREAAEWARCSYNSAWAVRKKMCDDEVSARAAEIAPVVSIAAPPAVSVSDGSTASYYELPEGAKELQDLISYKDMNAQMGEIFRGTYRYGQASHSDRLRDAKKIRFYIDAEIKRLEAL
tara:strand:+ start:638 stop:1060 length:423 start_codon:yes stop_codon:yes gene_type:complete